MSLSPGGGIPPIVPQIIFVPRNLHKQSSPQFNVINQKKWEGYVMDNNDSLGKRVIRFASDWAHEMEEAMKQGKTLPEVANIAKMDAFIGNRIKPEEQQYAAVILSKVWAHGEELIKLMQKVNKFILW